MKRITFDEAEAQMIEAVEKAMRSFLSKVSRQARAALSSSSSLTVLTAAGSPSPISPEDPEPVDLALLGELNGWWAAEVASTVAPEIERIFENFRESLSTPSQTAVASSLDSAEAYLSKVTDRLVRGITPPLPDEAFDLIRSTIAEGITEGWSTEGTAQHIAKRFSWEVEGDYWRAQKAHYAAKIDEILDPLGPPGSLAREAARLNDPRVQSLRDLMNRATKNLDREQSYWNTRAVRIARTESTGAYNFASLDALSIEGVRFKKWNASYDSRTRPEHRDADGQVAALDSPFLVGGQALMFPGDPSGAARLTINCRCFIVGVNDLEGDRTPPAIPSPIVESPSEVG